VRGGRSRFDHSNRGGNSGIEKPSQHPVIQLTESIIDGALSRIGTGLTQYCWIQEKVHARNVSQDYVFQNHFNAFYRVRRGSDWQHHFYTLLEASKANGITFAHALHVLLEQTSRLEASFASKLVATLHPEKPVIDQHVLRNFGLRLPSGGSREHRCVACYERLCENYAALMKSAEGAMALEKFNILFPWAKITDLKKLDLVLWQIRNGN
jgi:hypothetical protein